MYSKKGFEGWKLLTASVQIAVQPEAMNYFASVFTNYGDMIG